MASKVRPTPPPGGPALVRPAAMGALLLSLSGAACGDDSTSDTANDSEPPMVLDEGPMPGPGTNTNDDGPPMIGPTTTDDTAPMPAPTSTGLDSSGTTGGEQTTGTGTGADDAGVTTDPPPMPDPTTGQALPSKGPQG